MNQENCPCCPNHCLKDNLGCGLGKEYFSNQGTNREPKTLNEQVISDLRKCGHLLHHYYLKLNNKLRQFLRKNIFKFSGSI